MNENYPATAAMLRFGNALAEAVGKDFAARRRAFEELARRVGRLAIRAVGPTWRVVRLCDATHPDGPRCEQEQDHDGQHQYTVWTHPNQYGSRPKHPVYWSEEGQR